MALPESLQLSRYRDWRVFGTGTFSGRIPSETAQRKLVFAFLYEAAKIVEIPFGRLVWCTRRERGELGLRVHYHWLIGAVEWTPCLAECFMLNKAWDDLPRCGFSRNHIFNPALNGVEYITKCLSAPNAAQPVSSGGDYYEGEKFSHGGAEVTLSNSLVRVVGGCRVRALRH